MQFSAAHQPRGLPTGRLDEKTGGQRHADPLRHLSHQTGHCRRRRRGLDSAVFLKANSFNAGGAVSAAPVYANNLTSAYENCGQSYIKFSRGTGGNSQPLVISPYRRRVRLPRGWITRPCPAACSFPPDEALLPVNILPDVLTEGQEKIILLVFIAPAHRAWSSF